MTVKFASRLATLSACGSFTKLLFRWRGSVYKLIWREYVIYITLYVCISLTYRYILGSCQQRFFEKLVDLINASTGLFVRMSFVLGFFVNSIVCNWWKLHSLIPRPDTIALLVSAYLPGEDENIKMIRHTIIRYCILNLTQTFRTISPAFKQKYPELTDLVKAGILTENETAIIEKAEKQTSYGTQWIPIKWAMELLMETHQARQLTDTACTKILDSLDKFRNGCASLLEYESLHVPLVYIQVVTLCVYSYFLAQLLGSQWLIVPKEAVGLLNEKVTTECQNTNSHLDLDLYFPFMTSLQFVFYMGWLKVAESLINPFGSDDDDFELDEIIDRHLEVSYMMVDVTREKRENIKLKEYSEEPCSARFGISRFHKTAPVESKGGVYSMAFANEKQSIRRIPMLDDVAKLEDADEPRSCSSGKEVSSVYPTDNDTNTA